METPSKEDFDLLRDLLTNGSPEWILLFITLQRGGVVSTQEVMNDPSLDEKWKRALSKSRLSQAKRRLSEKGLLKVERFYQGSNYRVPYGLYEPYNHLFESLFEIVRVCRENNYFTAAAEMKKNAAERKQQREQAKAVLENNGKSEEVAPATPAVELPPAVFQRADKIEKKDGGSS